MTNLIVLAGGKGTRLRSVVSDVPKPLAPVGSTAFLDCLLSSWISWGVVTEIVLSVGYRYAQIVSRYGREFNGVPITYSIEDVPMGTGGAVCSAARLCEGPMYVVNGDTWHKPTDAILSAEKLEKPKTWLVSSIIPPVHGDGDRYGFFFKDRDGLIRFEEDDGFSPRLNAGTNWFSDDGRDALAQLHTTNPMSLDKDLLPKLVSCDSWSVRACDSEFGFLDIGTPEDYESFKIFWRNRERANENSCDRWSGLHR